MNRSSEYGYTAYEIDVADRAEGMAPRATADQIAAYVAANRAECGICRGTECFCTSLKPPEDIRVRRVLGASLRGHSGALRAYFDDEVADLLAERD